MFADNSVDEVMRNLESCEKISQTVETCHTNIITSPGNPKPIAASCKRTVFEGGILPDDGLSAQRESLTCLP